MAKWTPWGATKKFQVKIKSMKLLLEGFGIELLEEEETNRSNLIKKKEKKKKNRDDEEAAATLMSMIGIEVIWKGSKSGFVSFHRNQVRHFAPQKQLPAKTERQRFIQWDCDDQYFQNACTLQIAASSSENSSTSISKISHSYHPWPVSFHLLTTGDNEVPRDKMRLLGKGSLDLGLLASNFSSAVPEIQEKAPIQLLIDGIATEASLEVTVSFNEMKNAHSRTISQESMELGPNPDEHNNNNKFMKRAKSQGHRPSSSFFKIKASRKKDSNKTDEQEVVSTSNSDDSGTFDPTTGYVVVTNNIKNIGSNSVVELGTSSSSSETQLALVKKIAFWTWKRRRSSFKMTDATGTSDNKPPTDSKMQAERKLQASDLQAERWITPGPWEVKELLSRDGKTKLKADVFFGSYDQRSEKAAGESACTAIVVVIAHWLHLNPNTIPSLGQLDNLIMDGSSEWRKLCDDESHKQDFPDRHFDIETIEAARIRPITVSKEKSFHGFFNPEKFESLKELESFDKIWDKINEDDHHVEEYEQSSRIYIISWNDHFFILKMEPDANYIIDSLGERLYEGCNQAYVLKFDESCVMYGKVEKEDTGPGEVRKGEIAAETGGKMEKDEMKEEDEIICKGKECCKEYMKRFLAGIQLRELQEQEEKGITDPLYLCQRLQIDLHYTSSSGLHDKRTVSASPNSPLFNEESLV